MSDPKVESVKVAQNVITPENDKNYGVTAFIPVRVKTYKGRSID